MSDIPPRVMETIFVQAHEYAERKRKEAARIDTPPSIRERLARILYDMNKLPELSSEWEGCQGRCRDEWLRQVDAILTELESAEDALPQEYHVAFRINWRDALEQIRLGKF